MKIRVLITLATLVVPVSLMSAACSGAPDTASETDITQNAHYSVEQIYQHQVVDLKEYLTTHPDTSVEQALAELNRPIRLEAGHFLYPKDLKLPEHCSTRPDPDAANFVADFETCIVAPNLFDPTLPGTEDVIRSYLARTGQAPESIGTVQQAISGDGPATIWRTGVTTHSCVKSSNCKTQSKVGTKCEVKFFGLEFGCGAYTEIYEVCDVCRGQQVCENFENSEGGSFQRCGSCQC